MARGTHAELVSLYTLLRPLLRPFYSIHVHPLDLRRAASTEAHF